jgi:hypothetical protein
MGDQSRRWRDPAHGEWDVSQLLSDLLSGDPGGVLLAVDAEDTHLQSECDDRLVGGQERCGRLGLAVCTVPSCHLDLDVVQLGIQHTASLRDGDPNRIVGCRDVVDRHRCFELDTAVHAGG